MPSLLAPTHPPATMQKHEKKRVAGGASCNCLKIKGQICTHERGNLEVASDSWREKEEEKEMKWRRGEGVASGYRLGASLTKQTGRIPDTVS